MDRLGLQAMESAFRHAVAGGSYGEARDLLARYCEEAEGMIGETPPGSEARELAARVSGLLRWALRSTQAGRAQRRLELAMLSTARRYRNTSRKSATLRIDA